MPNIQYINNTKQFSIPTTTKPTPTQHFYDFDATHQVTNTETKTHYLMNNKRK